MKKTVACLSTLMTAHIAVAGVMGGASQESFKTYVAVTGGDYNSRYQSNYFESTSGVTLTQKSFNDTNGGGFGQIAVGTNSHIDAFNFDQQIVASFLWDKLTFFTPSSKYSYQQQADFGYDVMPKLNVASLPKVDLYGILGVHYGHFAYIKTTSSSDSETFNVSRNQLGFNLGVGVGYSFTPRVKLGVKYQYWQYGTTNVYGTNALGTKTEQEQITPSFNLVGIELRYYVA